MEKNERHKVGFKSERVTQFCVLQRQRCEIFWLAKWNWLDIEDNVEYRKVAARLKDGWSDETS